MNIRSRALSTFLPVIFSTQESLMSSPIRVAYSGRKMGIGMSRGGVFVMLMLLHGVMSFGAESFSPKPYEPQRQTIELGRIAVFETMSDIVGVRVADPRLCSAEVVGNDHKELAVTGLKRGTTSITVWFNRPGSTTQTYVVDVVTAPDAHLALEKFIAKEFPKSSIKLTPVPTSQKVIISGTACSVNQWWQILEVVDRSGIRCDEIIIRATIPCGCCR